MSSFFTPEKEGNPPTAVLGMQIGMNCVEENASFFVSAEPRLKHGSSLLAGHYNLQIVL